MLNLNKYVTFVKILESIVLRDSWDKLLGFAMPYLKSYLNLSYNYSLGLGVSQRGHPNSKI